MKPRAAPRPAGAEVEERGLLIKAAESRRALEARRRRLLEGGEEAGAKRVFPRPWPGSPARLRAPPLGSGSSGGQAYGCRLFLWGARCVNSASFSQCRASASHLLAQRPGPRWAEVAAGVEGET